MPNAGNCTLEELETAIRAASTLRSAERMTAIRALLVGFSRQAVCAIFRRSPKTLREWVVRFNEQGIDGLLDRPRPGRPRRIPPERTADLCALVEHPEAARQTHWTGKKFHGHLRTELQIEAGYSTVMRWLKEQEFRLKVPQPWPDRHDEDARKAFVRLVRKWLADKRIDLWYLDEMGVEGDPRPRRRFAKRGSKPRVTRNGDHVRMNVTGIICPRTGQFYALEFSHSDSVVFQTFLEHANRDVQRQRPRNLLICDNASWHKNRSLDWGAFEPIFLPSYSPDLNPIEKLWLIIKAEWFTDFIAKNHEQLIDRLDQALCWAIDRNKHNSTTCAIKTKL